jgi:hypothetical protein
MAILKKEIDGRYILLNDNRQIMSAALSLKNCQSIERGYNLDELAEFYSTSTLFVSDEVPTEKQIEDAEHISEISFKAGLQKAFELNADKRFTLKEMMDCWNKALTFQTHKETLGEHIQSLQQKEWDVEIEMICPHPSDTYRCGIQYGCDEDGCNHPNQIPYLDKDGCLILKRK